MKCTASDIFAHRHGSRSRSAYPRFANKTPSYCPLFKRNMDCNMLKASTIKSLITRTLTRQSTTNKRTPHKIQNFGEKVTITAIAVVNTKFTRIDFV